MIIRSNCGEYVVVDSDGRKYNCWFDEQQAKILEDHLAGHPLGLRCPECSAQKAYPNVRGEPLPMPPKQYAMLYIGDRLLTGCETPEQVESWIADPAIERLQIAFCEQPMPSFDPMEYADAWLREQENPRTG